MSNTSSLYELLRKRKACGCKEVWLITRLTEILKYEENKFLTCVIHTGDNFKPSRSPILSLMGPLGSFHP